MQQYNYCMLPDRNINIKLCIMIIYIINPTFLKPSLAGAHFPISYFQLDIHEKLPHYNILAIKYAHVYEHTTNEFKGKNQNITYTCKMYPIRAFIQFTFRNSNETS